MNDVPTHRRSVVSSKWSRLHCLLPRAEVRPSSAGRRHLLTKENALRIGNISVNGMGGLPWLPHEGSIMEIPCFQRGRKLDVLRVYFIITP